MAGKYDEAEIRLQAMSTHHQTLVSLCVRLEQGDPAAMDEIRSLHDKREGRLVWATQAKLLQRVGLATSPIFRVHAFGELSISRDGGPSIRCARRQSQHMLALLVLHREGLSSKALIERLFGEADLTDGKDSLHTAAYGLRKALKEAGSEDLLESTRGHYRLRWEEIAFCDLHEFDAFHAQAQILEAQGLETAGLLYQLALLTVNAPLFANLPDKFHLERLAHEERIRSAQTYLRTHPAYRCVFR